MRRTLALIATALFTFTLQAATHDVIKRGWNVAEGGTLHLDAGIGDVKIVCGGTGVAIEIQRDADSESYLKRHTVTFNQSGNDVTVTGKYESPLRFFSFGDNIRIRYNVRVPLHYNVDVDTAGGDVDLADLNGNVLAHTSGGDVTTGRLTGTLNLSTSGGDVDIAGANGKLNVHTSGGTIHLGNATGPAELKTSGGSIKVDKIAGDLYARTSGGSIKIEESRGTIDASTSGGSVTARFATAPLADSKLSTSGGSITVALPATANLDLDAHASGGGVDSELPVTVQGKHDEDSLNGKINAGGPRLQLRTSGGSINVRRL
jgi:DUF4097 and DUF4098 domain-containing protein YvlB